MYHRLFAACLLLVSACLAWIAWGYHAPFSYEPVGPRAYPLLLLGLLAAGALLIVCKPTLERGADEETLPAPAVLGKVGLCLLLLLAMAALFELLGFIVTSSLFALAMCRLFGGRWLHGAILAVVLGIGLYLLFDRILDVPLPLGVLAGLEF
ncbi:tripartite tricarboxylate transporter TctB family protein [Pseudomonas jilinensis]|uniref:Tripartite tricarboxylate transporter TctB family protein n=1 Tax=Pseudomonas jilinensis TaxID=2078689 RepID=A0A396S3D3_9PSED|nr:tripartite tricarboxylate transporter TctB family protein [Pseudomonas jilinensis]RHW20561.1 tripartite tricarboxylate transporter TctB family protein [Pseudomonas jilinensis]